MCNILIIEDDEEVRELISVGLRSAGYNIFESETKCDILNILREERIDLITLDLTLGNQDGLDLISEIRKITSASIIVISGRSAPVQRVLGLASGADDYITKPFHIREIILRAENQLKRSINGGESSLSCESIKHRFSCFNYDSSTKELTAHETVSVKITEVEIKILEILLENTGKTISRIDMSYLIWANEIHPLDRKIDGHVSRLRNKLKYFSHRNHIKSSRGVGYIFDES